MKTHNKQKQKRQHTKYLLKNQIHIKDAKLNLGLLKQLISLCLVSLSSQQIASIYEKVERKKKI